MHETLEQKKRQLQELLLRIPVSGSFDSVGLTRQVSQLTTEIEEQERLAREAQSRARIEQQGDHTGPTR